MSAEYIQAAWGDSLDHPAYADILAFIEKIKKSDEEHGAFWVGMEDGTALEVHQDLTIIFSDLSNSNLRKKAENWPQVADCFKLFLAGSRDFLN